MLIGYARVSTHDQTLALQQDALQKAGCNKIFTDTASGAKAERTGLDAALNYVRRGDTLVMHHQPKVGVCVYLPGLLPLVYRSTRLLITLERIPGATFYSMTDPQI
jgi:DNA invertase Pin-like site-specific DNA recombinase